jgi:hypothetical protein
LKKGVEQWQFERRVTSSQFCFIFSIGGAMLEQFKHSIGHVLSGNSTILKSIFGHKINSSC